MFVFGVALFGAEAFWSFDWATDRFCGGATAVNAPIIRALHTSRIFMLASVLLQIRMPRPNAPADSIDAAAIF